jgi:hypothetical protein
MTVLPPLGDALAEAADRHYGHSRRYWPPVIARRVPLFAAIACATVVSLGATVVALLDAVETDPGVVATSQDVTPVPESTLAASAGLTRAPAIAPAGADGSRPEPIKDREFARIAREIRTKIPYPPGASEDLGWLTAEGDMAQIDVLPDLQAVVEHHAGCAWLRFWLGATVARDAEAASRAATVLADIARWPTVRGARTSDAADRWAELASLARGGDVVAIRNEERMNCSAGASSG